MIAALTAPERETIVTTSDADERVRIWTAQRRHITRLRRDTAFTEVASGYHGSTLWAEFTADAERWSPAGVKRRRSVSAQQRAALSDRMRAVRGTSVAHGADDPGTALSGAGSEPASGGEAR